jgi:pimeloyl-ACP methyl ester carboxylesterase
MMASLLVMAKNQGFLLPPMLLYDRYGIGMSDRDPSDAGKPREERHDIKDAMYDLRQLVVQISEQKLGYKEAELDRLHLIFVAHSLGGGIARLYAAEFPGTVEALLLLDAVMSNKAFGDFIPDPDKPEEFKGHVLPEGVTPEMCRDALRKIAKSPYNFRAGLNREGIRWSNLPEQLPFNDAPRLQGPRKGLPLVTVMCSDLEQFSRNTGKVRRSSSSSMSSDRCYRS